MVLGVGGLGCGVAVALARLGVGKIILFDKDIVDISNLNRQILYDTSDIGKPKVDQAKKTLMSSHLINPDMQVEAYHMCAIN
jgi:molybdopterin/thiamine biosynthesis adenylyltransferase